MNKKQIYRATWHRSQFALWLAFAGNAVSFCTLDAMPLTGRAIPNHRSILKHPGRRENLTPSVFVFSQVPPSRESNSDPLRQPSTPSSSWFWPEVAGGVLLFGLTAGLGWRWVRHGKFFEMQPHEIAAQRLEEAWFTLQPERVPEYCETVQQILRRFLEGQLEMDSRGLSAEEFLRLSQRLPGALAGTERSLLNDILDQSERIASSGWEYSRPDLRTLHLAAAEFIHYVSHSNAATVCNFRNSQQPAEFTEESVEAELPRPERLDPDSSC